MVTPMKTVNSIPRPLGRRATIKLQITSESEGGIHLPEDITNIGRVMMVGYKDDVCDLNVGDLVFLPKADKVGDKFQVGDNVYLVIPMEYISAVLEDAEGQEGQED